MNPLKCYFCTDSPKNHESKWICTNCSKNTLITSNYVCKECFSPTSENDPSLSICKNCSLSKNSKYLSSIQNSKRNLDNKSKLWEKFSLISPIINQKLKESRKDLQNYKNRLKQVLKDALLHKIKNLEKIENNTIFTLQNWKNDIKAELSKVLITLNHPCLEIFTSLYNRKGKFRIKDKVFSLNYSISEIEKYIESIYLQRFEKLEFLFKEPEINLFLPKQNNVTKIYLASLTQKIMKFVYKEKIEWIECASWIEFNPDMILYCGGNTLLGSSGKAWIIDAKSLNAFQIKGCYDRKNHSMEFIDNHVLVFGGNTTRCQKFSVRFEDWSSISDIPEMKIVSSVKIEKTVMICGYNRPNVYKYNYDEDGFSNISSPFRPETWKLLFKHEYSLYCFVHDDKSRTIYKASFACNDWTLIKKNSGLSCYRCSCHAKTVGDYIFFVTDNEVLWRFCPKDSEIISFPVRQIKKNE